MGRTSFYQKHYQGWPPVSVAAVANPDSEYWHERAMDEAEKLSARMGYDAYCAWLDTQPEPITWSALYHMLVEHGNSLDACAQISTTVEQAA